MHPFLLSRIHQNAIAINFLLSLFYHLHRNLASISLPYCTAFSIWILLYYTTEIRHLQNPNLYPYAENAHIRKYWRIHE